MHPIDQLYMILKVSLVVLGSVYFARFFVMIGTFVAECMQYGAP